MSTQTPCPEAAATDAYVEVSIPIDSSGTKTVLHTFVNPCILKRWDEEVKKVRLYGTRFS